MHKEMLIHCAIYTMLSIARNEEGGHGSISVAALVLAISSRCCGHEGESGLEIRDLDQVSAPVLTAASIVACYLSGVGRFGRHV